jgi:hypothetical protein
MRAHRMTVGLDLQTTMTWKVMSPYIPGRARRRPKLSENNVQRQAARTNGSPSVTSRPRDTCQKPVTLNRILQIPSSSARPFHGLHGTVSPVAQNRARLQHRVEMSYLLPPAQTSTSLSRALQIHAPMPRSEPIFSTCLAAIGAQCYNVRSFKLRAWTATWKQNVAYRLAIDSECRHNVKL